MSGKSKLTLIVDGNWLLMSRMSVLQTRYSDDEKMCQDLKLMMIRSLNIVLRQFTEIDNVIFVSDGGSWRNKIEIPKFLQDEGVEYKGNRVKSEDINWDLIFSSYEDLMNKLKQSGITVCKEMQIEGDDWVWYLSQKLNSEGTNVMIWSKDKDLTQLVKVDKDNCFTVCWDKDKGVTTVHVDEDDMDFFFNEAYSENQKLYHSIIDKAKGSVEINPKEVVIDKIIRGDKGDNILPIIEKNSSKGGDKKFRVYQKDINPDLDYNDYEEYEAYLIELLNKKTYKDKVNKSLEDIIKHFEYNRRLVALEKESYPKEILEILEEHSTYNLCKDVNEVEYQLVAEANQINSILDTI